VSQVIAPALQWGTWARLDALTRSQPIALCHDGMAQRWLVVVAQAAIERAAKSVNKAQERACEAIQKHRFPLHAKRFETPDAAQAALAALRKSGR
jgi:signal transduction histidine kinase